MRIEVSYSCGPAFYGLAACVLFLVSGCVTAADIRGGRVIDTVQSDLSPQVVGNCVFQNMTGYDPDFRYRKTVDGSVLHITADAGVDMATKLDISIAPHGEMGSRLELRAARNVWGDTNEPPATRQIITNCARGRVQPMAR